LVWVAIQLWRRTSIQGQTIQPSWREQYQRVVSIAPGITYFSLLTQNQVANAGRLQQSPHCQPCLSRPDYDDRVVNVSHRAFSPVSPLTAIAGSLEAAACFMLRFRYSFRRTMPTIRDRNCFQRSPVGRRTPGMSISTRCRRGRPAMASSSAQALNTPNWVAVGPSRGILSSSPAIIWRVTGSISIGRSSGEMTLDRNPSEVMLLTSTFLNFPFRGRRLPL